MPAMPCPLCAATLDVPAPLLGGQVECGWCRRAFDAVPPREERRTGRPRDDRDDRDDPPPDPADPDRGYRRRGDYDPAPVDDGEDVNPDGTPRVKRGTGFATASLVLGVCGIVIGTFLFCIPGVQTIMGSLALVFGYLGLNTRARTNAIAGMVTGAITSLISLAVVLSFGALFTAAALFRPPPAAPPAAAAPVTAMPAPPPVKTKK